MKQKKQKFGKRREKLRLKFSHVSFGILIFAIFIIISMSLYLFLQFKTGDFVYKKDVKMIGQIKGISLPFNYIVQWQNGELTEESLFSIGKLSELDELSDIEIENILEKDNGQYNYYPGRVEGDAFVFEDSALTETATDEEDATKTIETTEMLVPGRGKWNVILKLRDDCEPRVICGEWSKCEVDYDLDMLIAEEMSSGIQYRRCKDYSDCVSDFIDSKRCEVKVPIEIKKVIIEGEEYVEIYDKEKDKLIARMKDIQLANIKKLNIEFVVS